jgi:hypothetical protein
VISPTSWGSAMPPIPDIDPIRAWCEQELVLMRRQMGWPKVRGTVRKRMGKATEEVTAPRAARARPGTRRTAH